VKHRQLTEQVDRIFLEIRDMQREVQKKLEDIDRYIFLKSVTGHIDTLKKKYEQPKVHLYLDEMVEDMADNLAAFRAGPQQQPGAGGPWPMLQGNPFQPYQVNLLVDNNETRSQPIVVEHNPNYKNLFGTVERVVDRSGMWTTDFSRIHVGSLVKANGGFLVLNLMDVLQEAGVWQGLKRALKTDLMEIQTFDPFYLFTTSGLKPEPIELDVKVIVVTEPRLFYLLHAYDEDTQKIFKVRADFSGSMKKDDHTILHLARYIKVRCDEEKLKPFDRLGVAAVVEEAIRMAGRKEKLSTHAMRINEILQEADFWAGEDGQSVVSGKHVEKAMQSRIYRSSLMEEQIQEMIDRGSYLIDTQGAVVGQVNGLSVYSLGDHSFGKPTRITASTSMGRAGIINIEREAELSGSTHNKGVLILGGYLRKKYAQEEPLTMTASIAFEQSYSGVDGDSASSTEIYAILSSLSGLPLRQDLAVTGSVNQKGEVQAIGGANQKIEGFFDCCKARELTGTQGVLLPESNVQDLMLRKDVVEAVANGLFHVYAVKTIDQGIEILTGVPAGGADAEGSYPEGSVNFLVHKKLSDLAAGLKKFFEGEEKESASQNEGKKQ
jgi:lon-related putative ATP-dependent protease